MKAPIPLSAAELQDGGSVLQHKSTDPGGRFWLDAWSPELAARSADARPLYVLVRGDARSCRHLTALAEEAIGKLPK